MNKNKDNIVIVSLALVALVLVGFIGFMLFSLNTKTQNQNATNDSQSSTGYEPQSLSFDNKDGDKTIDAILNDSDKSFQTTSKDTNFEELDTEADFGV
jgi:hypothetical protein